MYKLASQRLIAFVDDTTSEGDNTLYNGKINSELLDPVYKYLTKKDFIFSRFDIYFCKNKNYYSKSSLFFPK